MSDPTPSQEEFATGLEWERTKERDEARAECDRLREQLDSAYKVLGCVVMGDPQTLEAARNLKAAFDEAGATKE